MNELLPLVSGLVAGALLGAVATRLRLPVGIALAVTFGVIATVVTGEFRVSWGYLLVDIPLVGAASLAGFAASRIRRRVAERGVTSA